MSSFSIARGVTPYRSRLGWLPASIALNLLLIGLLGAWVWNMPSPPRQPLVTWQREIMPTLSLDDAAIATRASEKISDSQKVCDDAVRAEYVKIRTLLAIEPVDTATIQADFDQIISFRNTQQTTALHAFADELSTVSADGRQKLRAAMIKESQRSHPVPGR
jgi:hypothetical protein